MSSVDGSRVARDKLTQWHWSGAVFCPACLMQSVETAGPDGVREQGPILFIRLWRLGHRLGCPCSRSDRSAITSHRARNLV